MAALNVETGGPEAGFALWQPLARTVTLQTGDVEFDAVMRAQGPDRQIWTVQGAEVIAERVGGRWMIDGQIAPEMAQAGNRITVFADYGLPFTVIDPLERATAAHGDGNLIEAPMPGLVKAVFATAGQAVAKGDRLAILEAMKMEHALLAARDGIVAEVLAIAGVQVEAGAALVQLEPEE
jgi:3-methylcrotonyl-CoA carboxylase alpha subunit